MTKNKTKMYISSVRSIVINWPLVRTNMNYIYNLNVYLSSYSLYTLINVQSKKAFAANTVKAGI